MKRILILLLILPAIVFASCKPANSHASRNERNSTQAAASSVVTVQTSPNPAPQVSRGPRFNMKFAEPFANYNGFADIYLRIPNAKGEGTPHYSHLEGSPDTAFVSGSLVFVKDFYGQRILVYKDGKYLKSIQTPYNYDFKLFDFDPLNNCLSAVYLDIDDNTQSHYYSTRYDVTNGEQLGVPADMNKENHPLVGYYFDDFGKLETCYIRSVNGKLGDSVSNESFMQTIPEVSAYIDRKSEFGLEGVDQNLLFKSADGSREYYYCCFLYLNNHKQFNTSYIFLRENGIVSRYAKVMPLSQEFNRGMFTVASGGEQEFCYQITAYDKEVRIYRLVFEPMDSFEDERARDASFAKDRDANRINTYDSMP